MIGKSQRGSALIDNDVALLGNVDAVQKLADILPLDGADLLDERARARNILDIVTLEDDLVLDIGGALDGHARQTVNDPDHLRQGRKSGGASSACESTPSHRGE